MISQHISRHPSMQSWTALKHTYADSAACAARVCRLLEMGFKDEVRPMGMGAASRLLVVSCQCKRQLLKQDVVWPAANSHMPPALIPADHRDCQDGATQAANHAVQVGPLFFAWCHITNAPHSAPVHSLLPHAYPHHLPMPPQPPCHPTTFAPPKPASHTHCHAPLFPSLLPPTH